MSSLSMSSVSSMQGQFSDYLNAMDSSLMSKVSSFREMIPDLSGWNLTGFGIDTDLEKSVEKFHDKSVGSSREATCAVLAGRKHGAGVNCHTHNRPKYPPSSGTVTDSR